MWAITDIQTSIIMHYNVQQQWHKSNCCHWHTEVYMQVTRFHAHHQHAEQRNSHHTIRFRPDLKFNQFSLSTVTSVVRFTRKSVQWCFAVRKWKRLEGKGWGFSLTTDWTPNYLLRLQLYFRRHHKNQGWAWQFRLKSGLAVRSRRNHQHGQQPQMDVPLQRLARQEKGRRRNWQGILSQGLSSVFA